MMEQKYDVIVVPDIHGRTFWKDAMPYIENGTNVVFLGDYLDPYPHEDITPEEALRNFREILQVTHGHENVTLLVGNHDIEYIIDNAPSCRCDYDNYDTIRSIFNDVSDRLRIGVRFREDCSTAPVTFTHAGIDTMWYIELVEALHDINPSVTTDDILFKYTLKDIDDAGLSRFVSDYLCRVSTWRGGMNRYGSCVWADINEFRNGANPSHGLQIVGHTMQIKKQPTGGGFVWVPAEPVSYPNIVCVDCQKCFALYGNTIKEL